MEGESKSDNINIGLGFDLKIKELEKEVKKAFSLIRASEKRLAKTGSEITKKNLAEKKVRIKKSLSELEALYIASGKSINVKDLASFKKHLKEKERSQRASLAKEESDRKEALARMFSDAKKSIKKRENAEKISAQKQANTYTSKWKRAFGTLTRYMSAGVLIGAFTQLTRSIVTEFLNVEKAIYRISGITGDSVRETSKLTNTIYGLATSYGVATDDVTQFAIEMAKLGKSSDEIQKLGNATASLSVILGENMVSSGKLLVTTMNQFNLVTSEASRVSGVFSKIIKSSPIAVDDLKTAFQYVGVAANAAGIELEDLGNYITLLSNSGIGASKIGTGLRNVILKLTDDGRTFNQVMDELYASGISLEEALDLFDKRGATVGYLMVQQWGELRDIINETPTAIEQMTTTLIVASSKSAKIAGIWAEIKSIAKFFIGNDNDIFAIPEEVVESTIDYRKAIEDVNSALANIGYPDTSTLFKNLYDGTSSVKEISTLYAETLKKINKERAQQFGSNAIFLQSEYDSVFKNLTILKKQNDIQKESNKLIAEAETHAKERNNLLIEHVRLGKANLTEAEPFVDKFVEQYKTSLEGLFSPKEITKKADSYRKTLQNLLNNAYSKPLEEMARELRDNIGKYKKEEEYLLQQAALGKENLETNKRRGDAQIALEKSNKELGDYLCKLGYLEFCDDAKNNAGKYRKYIDNRLKKVKKDLILARAYYKAQLEKETEGLWEGIAAGKSEVSRLENPQEYFRNEIGILGIPILDEVEYKKYVNTTINKQIAMMSLASAQYMEALADENKKSQDKYIEQLKEIDKIIAEGSYDPKINKDYKNAAEWKKGMEAERNSMLAEMINSNTSFLSKIDAEKKRVDAAVEIMKKKGVSLEDAFLIYDEKVAEEKIKKIGQLVNKGIGEIEDIATKYMQTAHDNRMAMLDAEMEAIQARYDVESDILKSSLENNLITQETYERKREELEKKRIKEENKIAKDQFEAQKKNDIAMATANAVASIAQAFVTAYLTTQGTNLMRLGSAGITSGIIAAKTIAEIDAINKRKFYPVKYEEGGYVYGKSHKEGGVPFKVSGSSTHREMEGGEYIIKKSSVTAKTIPILDSINKDTKYNPNYFASGGRVPESMDVYQLQRALESVQMRAYITTRDLDANDKRKVKTNNRITLWN